MLFGRLAEIKYLNEYYNQSSSQIIVVYGQKNIGKTALLMDFLADKPAGYYLARSCSEREQIFQWSRELNPQNNPFTTYEDILSAHMYSSLKKVIVIDEFQNLVKASPSFPGIAAAYFRQHADTPVLMILCSSSVGWIENSMIKKLGETAFALSGLLKIKELHFMDMQKIYTGFSQQQCLEIYAILGGVPGLWKQFDSRISVRENIITNILPCNSFFSYEAERILGAELRETGVYNTLLACMASGMHKLNELYRHTGFSRAKISVYLKNLMELEIVEKVNDRTGTYLIKNQYVHFYYTFIYPNMSFQQLYSPQEFFDIFMKDHFAAYVTSYWESFHLAE